MKTASKFGLLQWTIVILTVFTAGVHIWLGLTFPDNVFLLNGLGYLALTALLFLPLPALARYHNLVRWVLIGYTLVTVVAWYFIGVRSTIAYVDKAVELVLIVCLTLDWLLARKRSA